VDLKKFIQFSSKVPGYEFLTEFLDAPPTAELEPRTANYIQTDEVDMGMSYVDLSVFGSLRKIQKFGPYSMFEFLQERWRSLMTPEEVTQIVNISKIAEKVKKFFFYYGINRHKTTVLPPSYHMSAYSPDSNRFDLRPFLYSSWSWQFKKIDELVETQYR
jgi:NAD+ synthase (glutamine-hydrolysing)